MSRPLSVFLLCSTFLLAACPPVGPYGREVGAPCETDRDCADECQEGDAFGGGMCTKDCTDDKDCPTNTRCILVGFGSGVCAMKCDTDNDCQGFQQRFECLEVRDRQLDLVEVCLDR